jgi:hypothetical protein
VQEQVQEHSFNRIERTERQQSESACPPVPTDEPVPPAAASPSASAVPPARDPDRAAGEGEEFAPLADLGQAPGACVAHLPTGDTFQQSAAQADPTPTVERAPSARKEVCALARTLPALPPADATPAALVAYVSALVTVGEGPAPLVPTPREVGLVLRKYGREGVRDVAAVLGSPEGRQDRQAAQDALDRLCADDPAKIRNAGGRYRDYVRRALRGELSLPTSHPRGGHVLSRLAHETNDAVTRAEYERAALLRELSHRAGCQVTKLADGLTRLSEAEETPALAEALERARLATRPPPPVLAVLPAPRALPAHTPRTNRSLFRVPDE